MHTSFHTNGLIVNHALFSIATLSVSAHTQSFYHISRGSLVCVLLSKIRWGNDILEVSMNKEKGKKNSSKPGECSYAGT